MAYAKWGSGSRSFIMIPGGPGNTLPDGWFLKATVAPILPLLEEDFTIWLIARRQNMPHGHSVEDMAADYAALIDSDFGGSVDVVFGASYGGIVAQYLAANHPEVFKHIIVAVAACKVENAHIDYEFAEKISEGRLVEACSVMFKSLYPKPPVRWLAPLGAWILARSIAAVEHPFARQDILIEAKAEVAFDSRPALPRIKVPVLLINGSEDSYFPMNRVEETASLIPNCTSIIYEGKNHVQAAMDKRLPQDILAFIST